MSSMDDPWAVDNQASEGNSGWNSNSWSQWNQPVVDLEAWRRMSNPLNCWTSNMIGSAEMTLIKGCNIPDGEPRNPQLDFLVKDGWERYCIRQGKGRFIRFSPRSEYCEYMGKFYTYVLPIIPREQTGDLHDFTTTSLHVYERIFMAWRKINDLFWTLSTDYFSARLVLSFHLHGIATANEL